MYKAASGQFIARLPLQQKLICGLAGIFLMLGIFALSMINTLKDVEKSNDLVLHTESVISSARNLTNLMIDMETGIRGFLLTGKDKFLEPFYRAETEFATSVAALKDSVNYNPVQLERLKKIHSLQSDWLAKVAYPEIELRRQVTDGEKTHRYLENKLSQGTGQALLDTIAGTAEQLRDEITKTSSLTPKDKEALAILSIQLVKDMLDQEVAQRSYLVTGEDKFLAPYFSSQQLFNRHLEEARRITRDLKSLDRYLTEISLIADEWKSRSAEPEIEARRAITQITATFKNITDMVESEIGKTITDTFRVLIDEFITTEQQLMVERSVIADNANATANTVATAGAVAAIIFGVLLFWTVNRMILPLRKMTETMNEIAETEDYTRRLDDAGMPEVRQVALVFNRLAEKTEYQIWLKNSASDISRIFQDADDIPEFSNKVCSTFGRLLNCGFSAFYLLNTINQKYELSGSYRFKGAAHQVTSYALQEGLVGQCAYEKHPIIQDNVPQDYFKIHSGLGESSPDTVMVIPLIFREEVLGVLELATLGQFKKNSKILLEEQIPNLALGLESLLRRIETEKLLHTTQVQAEELQVREEELRDSNKLLEQQSNELKKSQTKLEERNEQLQVQQEELRVANEELEERAKDLNLSRSELEDKNLTLETIKLELERRAEQLAMSSKYKSEFLANMSHELRTPLNSLLILAKLLADNPDANLSEKQVRFAQTIYESGEDLLNLINEILDLSKIEAGKVDVYLEKLSLNEFVAELERKFLPVSNNKNISFQIETELAPNTIRSDTQKLGQIIKNFLSNAFKFTEQGSVTLKIAPPEAGIELSNPSLNSDNALAFSVIDTGIGIPKDKQSAIFEAFHQVDGSISRKFGGTGLGLSISRELAKLLGGEIHISSEEGKGSTFMLIIPRDPEMIKTVVPAPVPTSNSVPAVPEPLAEPAATIRQKTTSPASTSAMSKELPDLADDRQNLKQGDRSILIIEDDARFTKIVADVARDKGFSILIAEDGEMGLYLADYYKPSGIILDLGLPGMDGWEVMSRLKDNPETRHIPVHFMSAEDSSLDAMRSGAIGFLTKPVSLEDIESVFKRFEHIIDRPVKHLLLVEDDDKQRQSMLELIGSSDLETTSVKSGKEALKLIVSKEFDCIVMDYSLPDMTALELLEQLAREDVLKQTPVVCYTGKELEPREKAALEHYAQSIIVKDVRSPERLLDDTSLFLHRIEANLPEEQRKTIRMLHNREAVFEGRKALLVDDDMRNIFSLSAVLQQRGMSVQTASNGREAIEHLSGDEHIDIILMDIMMPEMDGYEAMKAIRQMPHRKDVPIIALTAKAMKGDRAACLEAGASDYLAKPVVTEKLLSIMRVWLYR